MRTKITLLTFSVIIIGLLLLFLNSCNKENPQQNDPPKVDPKSLAVLSTTAVTEITQTSAVSGGNVTSDGGATVTARGLCWSTSQSPTISDSKIASGSGTGLFTANVANLTAGTSYYVRAYATNSVGTSYGSSISFVTDRAVDLPAITTAATTDVSAITQTTASFSATITADGGAAITARGVCWGTTANPTISNSKTTDGTGTGSFTSSITGLLANTTYHVRVYATNSKGTSYGNDISFTTPKAIELAAITPAVPTDVSAITQTTASFSVTITSDGGAAITARGVCWGTAANPTISNSKTTDGTGTGSFTSSITGLLANTTYHVRVYATNSKGTNYGNDITFTTLKSVETVRDVEGNVYKTVIIGTQTWMAENLRTKTYNDNNSITLETDNILWDYKTSSAYCWYDNDQNKYGATYGALYNWYAVDTKKICPVGWHVPSDAEWTILSDYLISNGYGYLGSGIDIAKSLATKWGWNVEDSNSGAVGYDAHENDRSGFSGPPAGCRGGRVSMGLYGSYNMGSRGQWWSSTVSGANAYTRHMFYYGTELVRTYSGKSVGLSVRCVKD